MRVLIINGSPRKKVCAGFINEVIEQGAEAGHTVEVVNLYDHNFAYCDGCMKCEKTGKCGIKDTYESVVVAKYKEADLVILATPNYFAMPTAIMKTTARPTSSPTATATPCCGSTRAAATSPWKR